MGRAPCCDELGLKKGPWTPEEDKKLKDFVEKNGGHGSWRRLPKLAGLNRCGKSCRLRWTNYLRPDIKRGKFTKEEEELIIHLHSRYGNKWSTIATSLPGRTDNEIKNYWNTHMRRKLLQRGIDPVTHQPRTDLKLLANLPKVLMAAAAAANLSCSFTSISGAVDNSLQLQAADAAHLFKLQLVQNLVQVLTTSSQPSSSTPNLNLMGLLGLLPILTRNYYQMNDVLPLSVHHHLDSLVNGSLIPQNLANSLHPSGLEPSISCFVGEGDQVAAPADDLSSENMMMNKDCTVTGYCEFPSSAGSSASLASASPEHMNKSEAISIDGSIDTPIDTPISTPSTDTWDSLNLEDLDNDLGYWKEILGQLST